MIQEGYTVTVYQSTVDKVAATAGKKANIIGYGKVLCVSSNGFALVHCEAINATHKNVGVFIRIDIDRMEVLAPVNYILKKK